MSNPLKTIAFKLTGLSPLLLHNGRLANPLDPYTKAIREVSSIRKKSDDDIVELSRREFLGSLYLDGDGFPCVTDSMVEAALVGGAKQNKLGKKFKSAVFTDGDFRIDYSGRRKGEDLWNDKRFVDVRGVKVGMARVMRTRPIFREWSINVPVQFNVEVVNEADVVQAMRFAGSMIGVGDYRPKFGRFDAEVI